MRFSLQLFECPAELVGTTGGFIATAYAVEQADDLIGRAARHQLGDALGVAVTSAVEETMGNPTVLVGLHIDELATCVVTGVKHTIQIKN